MVAFANTAGGVLLLGVEDTTRHVRSVANPLAMGTAGEPNQRQHPSTIDSGHRDIAMASRTHVLAVQVYPSPGRPHCLKRAGLDGGVYVRVGSTNRRADRELIDELRRFARGETYDEQAMPEVDSEALDFRVASELFAPARKLKRADLETLRLMVRHHGRKVPTVGGMLLFGKERERCYQTPSWPHARRVVGIRQHIKRRAAAKGKTLSLFADDPQLGQYRYAALVTDLTLPAQEIWRSYRGRADCENRIKELKYDFAADSFCLNDFWATEACLNVAMLAYNLMSLFRQAVLKTAVLQHGAQDVQHTLKTLRYKLFAKAGYIVTQGRKDILKLCVAMRQREWLEGLWDRSKTFDMPVRFAPVFMSG